MAIDPAVLAAFTKYAFGPEAAKQVFKAFKGKQLPRAAYKALAHEGLGAPVGALRQQLSFAGLQTGRKGVREAKKLQSAQLSQLKNLAPESVINEVRRHGDAVTESFTKRLPAGGATLQSMPAGRLMATARKAGVPLPVLKTPKEKKMLEGVLKGHELAETQVRPTQSFRHFGHLSPDVILREHNMVTTLPREHAQVGETIRRLRNVGGEAEAMRQATGLEFGRGQRFSRHARKHLTRMIENQG